MNVFTHTNARRLLLSGAALIGVSALASRMLGLIRDRLLAGTFGAGPELDAYFAAYRLPDLLFNLLVLGTLSAAFLPVFTTYLARSKGKKSQREAFAIAESLITLTVIVLSILAGILAITAPMFVPLIAPGFDEYRTELAVTLTRIMLLQPILLGVSSVLGSILTGMGKFLAYATAPVLYNLGIIIGVLVLVPYIGVPGLAWGVVIGALLHMIIQLPHALKLGLRFRPDFCFRSEGMQQIGRLILPRMVGLGAGQAGNLIVTFVGSGLAAGSIAAYMFADNLAAVPIGIVGISFAVAAFPQLSTAAAKNEVGTFITTLVRSIRFVLFLILPLSAAMVLLRAEIVRVVLGTGMFSWEDTVLTLEMLGILSVSVFAQSLIPLLARAFFSLQDTRTPMIVSIVAVITNITLALWLTPTQGGVGLAMAFAGASIVHFVLLITILRARIGTLHDRELFFAIARIGLATLLASIAIQYLKEPVGSFVDMQRLWGVLAKLGGTSAGGAAVYLIITYVLGMEETRILLRFRKRS